MLIDPNSSIDVGSLKETLRNEIHATRPLGAVGEGIGMLGWSCFSRLVLYNFFAGPGSSQQTARKWTRLQYLECDRANNPKTWWVVNLA